MDEREQLTQGIAALEAQRATLGDAVVDTAIAALREKLAAMPLAEGQALPPDEQRKQVTILFADVAGFTAMSETMDPEEVRDTINDLWQRFDAAIQAHQGTIDKHMGDAVMALFGAPTAQEDDPERALQTALAMQEELRTFVGERHPSRETQRGTAALQLRIGVHTGPVLLGTVGTTGEYTAMGDAVNVASRLQQAAPVGGILISHDTYRHVRGVFSVQPLEPLAVRGKADPIPVYLVRAAKPRAFRVVARGVEGIETPMVGREAEIASLQQALEAVVRKQQVRAVTVVGEAGVGKSRLLYEFSNWIDLSPLVVWFFKGRASQQAVNLPYFLIRDLFSFRFEIQDSDSAAVARDKIVRSVASFMGPAGIEKSHFLGQLIGFDFSGSPFLRGILGDARQVHDRAFHYAVQFFAAVAAQGPALLFLEDIHWADEGSLDLIEHLIRSGDDLPLLIVCLARPSLYERRPNWCQGLACHQRLDLAPLSDQSSLSLVGEILRQVADVPPDLRDLIVERAEGNPYYIEELVKMLVEDRVIVKGAAQWQVRPDRLVDVRVPATLTGVLQARLDSLPLAERTSLQRAAVVGRIFWEGAVAQLGRESTAQAHGALEQLRDKELVFERIQPAFSGENEYIFKHALLRDVTYESVLKRQRRIYHAQVAEWLIAQSGERVGEYAGLIGEHFERAGEPLQAVAWYERAGRQARDTYTPATAIDYYRKALAALPADSGRAALSIPLYEGLAGTLLLQARLEEGLEAYEALRQAAEAGGDTAALARAWNALAGARDRQGNHALALEHADRAERFARAAGVPTEQVTALCRKGQALLRQGNGEAALAVAGQALEISSDLGESNGIALCLNLLGSVHELLGHFSEAQQYRERALALYQELGNRNRQAGVLNNLGEAARLRGEYDAAIAVFREALAVAQEIGDRTVEHFVRSNLGGALAGRGDSAAAEEELRAFLDAAAGSGWVGLVETYRFLSEACLGQGKVAEAEAAAQRALELLHGHEEPALSGPAWRALGMVAARVGRPVQVAGQRHDAAGCFAASLQLLTASGIEAEQARTLRAWARHEATQGHDEAAGRMLRQAREILTRLGMTSELGRSEAP